VSEQQEEESLRRWAREQAEIERQTDALVLRTLTTLVSSSADLKSKLRRDVESILEGYRRSKRQLENEISLTTAERLRSRREAEQERAAIVAEAKAQAREIVQAAERERETLLAEVRAMEQRLRSLEGQIRSVFGDGDAEPGEDSPAALVEAPDTVVPFVPGSPAAPGQLGGQLDEAPVVPGADDAAQDSGQGRPEIQDLVTEGPAPVSPAGAVPESARAAPPAEPAVHGDAEALAETPSAPVAPPSPTVSVASAPPPTATPSPVASLIPSSPAPAPERPVRPAPPPARAYPPRPAPARRRPVELVFDGVPGYQQASALERAVNDLLPNEEIDILQFERGQLVLGLQATDLGRLADQLVAGSPASLELEAVAGDRARFRCV
jgi:hypothetical protein